MLEIYGNLWILAMNHLKGCCFHAKAKAGSILKREAGLVAGIRLKVVSYMSYCTQWFFWFPLSVWQDSFVGTDGNSKAVLRTFGITPAPGTLAARSEMI